MENLNDALKACKILVINGETYFGTAEKNVELDKITISDAVEVTTKGDFKKVVKDWIKAVNSKKLETFTVDGLSTLTTKSLTEEQLMRIDAMATDAAYRMGNVMPELWNKSIDEM